MFHTQDYEQGTYVLIYIWRKEWHSKKRKQVLVASSIENSIGKSMYPHYWRICFCNTLIKE